jgi:uncharacterized protein YeaO (DUF488 family)
MLKTKCILSKKEISDGFRISVMSKHTLNDGITPDVRIDRNSFDDWRVLYAPPLKLIGDYYKRNLSWEIFEEKYNLYLNSIYNEIKNLVEIAIKEDVTLLCIEESPKRCHRKLLTEKCKLIYPDLEILIK